MLSNDYTMCHLLILLKNAWADMYPMAWTAGQDVYQMTWAMSPRARSPSVLPTVTLRILLVKSGAGLGDTQTAIWRTVLQLTRARVVRGGGIRRVRPVARLAERWKTNWPV